VVEDVASVLVVLLMAVEAVIAVAVVAVVASVHVAVADREVVVGEVEAGAEVHHEGGVVAEAE